MPESVWWKRGIIYQIYPRSFQDSNGDGIGDLEGIRRRSTICHGCVDAIWVSPVYPSPMADFGYDVADYCDIDPLFGTLADFDELVDEAHARGLKVILDFVPNHTSDKHPWFIESRASRDDPKRDWYIWRDPASPTAPRPTIGCAISAVRAWTFDAADGPVLLPHLSCASSPISIGAILLCAKRCMMCCASGSSAASMAFASM